MVDGGTTDQFFGLVVGLRNLGDVGGVVVEDSQTEVLTGGERGTLGAFLVSERKRDNVV